MKSTANLDEVEDLALFIELLKPGQRSAIFGIWSSSSQNYTGDLALHFFYLERWQPKISMDRAR